MENLILTAITILCVAGCISVIRLIHGAYQVGLDLQADENCGQLVVDLPWEDCA